MDIGKQKIGRLSHVVQGEKEGISAAKNDSPYPPLGKKAGRLHRYGDRALLAPQKFKGIAGIYHGHRILIINDRCAVPRVVSFFFCSFIYFPFRWDGYICPHFSNDNLIRDATPPILMVS
jgi:hypothetical protein